MEDFLLSVSFACRFSLLAPLSLCLFQVVPTRQTFPFSSHTLQGASAIGRDSQPFFKLEEKKMIFIPIFFLAGFSVAGVLNDTATELSPHLKREEFPWHLLSIAIFFILLKLPGPSFPYWARIFVPHFANGGLWRMLGFTILWYRKPQDPSTSVLRTPADEIHS
ncbi:hypothetical protein AAC387_Pa05g1370 [Persea americana]